MESSYLRTLVEVVRTGSFSRAAEVQGLTQPAISRRIKALEERYGCELLDRSGPVVLPTRAGQLVYDAAENLLGIEESLASGLRVLGGKTKISFSCAPSFGIAHLPQILREFMLACPDSADLRFAFSPPEEILQGLTRRSYDLAVMDLCDWFDLTPYRVFPVPGHEVIFASAPALGLPAPETPIEALFDVPLYARHEGCCSRLLLAENLKKVGREFADFRRSVVLDDLHLIVQTLLAGEGTSFLSTDVVGEHLASGRLVAHRVPGFRHERQRVLVLEPGFAIDEVGAQFLAALFGRFDAPIPAELEAPSASSGRRDRAPAEGESTVVC